MSKIKISDVINSPNLPTLPTVAMKLLDASKDPQVEIQQVVNIIKSDPAIAGKILKAANSSYFALQSRCTTMERAISLLGINVSTSLALSFSLADETFTNSIMRAMYQNYWLQSIVQAVACEKLGAIKKTQHAAEFFLAGLLMDLGRLAMLKTIPREYFPVLQAASQQQFRLSQVEYDQLGFSHAEVTSQMIASWNFPTEYVDAILHQNDEAATLIEMFKDPKCVLQQCMVTASAIGEYFCSDDKLWAHKQLEDLLRGFFDYKDDQVEQLMVSMKDKIVSAGEIFDVPTESLPDPRAMIMEANQRLLNIAMSAHVQNTQLSMRQEMMEKQNQELMFQNVELKQKNELDALTAVYNRSYFNTAIEDNVESCRQSAEPISVIFIDIDKFKSFNDNYGHMFGDQVLKNVARVIKENLRSSDVLARYGGEEFVVIVKGPTIKGLEKLTERLRASVEANKINFGDSVVNVTISIGAAMMIPAKKDKNDVKTLITVADELMYESKRNGRNQVHLKSLMSETETELLNLSMSSRFSRWLVNRQYIDIRQASRALLQTQSPWVPLGELAVVHRLLSEEQIQEIQEVQHQKNARFGEVAIDCKFLTPVEAGFLLALQQEDPQRLMLTLVNLGLVKSAQGDTYIREYLQDYQNRSNQSIAG
jgi:diguanylate cyclase (GGDEF)-like protein